MCIRDSSYIIAGYKHSSRLWLRTATHSVWTKHIEFILSDEIALYSTDTDGISIKSTWANVLLYEFQIRKLVCRKVLYEAKVFETALEESRLDLGLKERYFITPTAMSAAASRSGGKGSNATTWQIQDKGAGKGGKPLTKKQKKAEKRAASAAWEAPAPKTAKGKGKERRSKGRLTPDGRIVCTAHNADGCTYGATCKFVHCCSKCYDPAHTAATCRGQ